MVNQLQMIYNTLNLIEVKGHANIGVSQLFLILIT